MHEQLRALCERYPYAGDGRWVRPAYEGECIINLMHSLLAHYGLPHATPLAFHEEFARLLRGRRKIMLLVLDGLGWANLLDAMRLRPVIGDVCAQGACRPLTSVFPSTTSAAMTSVVSGLPPAQHGILGFTMYFPRYGRVFNMLGFRTLDAANEDLLAFAFDPTTYIGHPGIPRRLEEWGLLTSAYVFRGYADSGLSRLLYHDARLNSYVALGDLLAMALSQLRAPLPQFLFLYWASLDTIAHTHGARSEAYAVELDILWTALRENILPALGDDAALIVTADHGHLDGDDAESINLMAMPEVLEALRAPPAGEGRAMHLFLRPGSMERVRARLTASGEMTVLTKAAFLASGLLGNPPVRPGLDAHLGDLIALPHGSRRLLYDYQPRPHTAMVGRHGGLTPEEMAVPLVVF